MLNPFRSCEFSGEKNEGYLDRPILESLPSLLKLLMLFYHECQEKQNQNYFDAFLTEMCVKQALNRLYHLINIDKSILGCIKHE